MKFYQYGSANPNTKDQVVPIEFVDVAVFRRLDFLLGYLQEHNEEIQKGFIGKFQEKLTKLVVGEYVSAQTPDFSSTLEKYAHLKTQPELVKLAWQFFLSLLQIPIERALERAPVEVPNRNYLRSYLVPRYTQAVVLSEMLGKDTAINLLKGYIDDYTISVGDLYTKYEDLESKWDSFVEDAKEGDNDGWVVVISDIEDGKYIFRNDNCKWIEALDDLEDTDLIYLVCCHGDFQSAKMVNENFVMTRERTIAEGDLYCDKVFHDVRLSSEIEHPGDEFWTAIDTQMVKVLGEH